MAASTKASRNGAAAVAAIAPPPVNLDGTGMRVGIVLSRFNASIGDKLLKGALRALRDHNVADRDVRLVTVPGALEVPLALQMLAQTKTFDALVAIGAVIRGETYHFEIVAGESARAIMDLTVGKRLCIGNGVLTVEDEAQAWARARVSEGDKGGGAARAALTMIDLKQQLLSGKR